MTRVRRRAVACLRFAVGAVLVVSAAAKSQSPVQSVEAVAGFHAVAASVAVWVGLLLPGLEAAAGAALLVGYRVRAAAALSAVLFASFAVVVSSAMVRSLDVDCGCFGGLAPFASVGPWTLLADVVLLAAGFLVWRTGFRPADAGRVSVPAA